MLVFWNRWKSQTSGRPAWAWGLCMYLEPLLSSCIGCLKGTWRVLSLGPVLDACQSIQASTTGSCYTVLFMLYWQMQMVELVSHNEQTSSNVRGVVKLHKQILSPPPFACTTTRWVHATFFVFLSFWLHVAAALLILDFALLRYSYAVSMTWIQE